MVSMDFDTSWCPVCDRQIAPKRTTQLVIADQPAVARQRNPQNRPVTKTKTIIDQGPSPLYCSDECKMADLLHQREDVYAPPTYSIYRTNKVDHPEGSSPSDFESDSLSSTTTDISSPTSENAPCNPITLHPKQRSRSFLSGRSSRLSGSRHTPSSLPTSSTLLKAFGDYEDVPTPPTNDDYLLSQFQGSFSRRSDSRVSLYSGPSSPTSRSPPSHSALSTSPRRERPLLAHGAEGKLLVPDVYVRVPSRPCASRRESTSSLVSMASSAYSAPSGLSLGNRSGSMASIASSRTSLKSPLGRHGSEFGDDEKDHHDLSEDEGDDQFEESHIPLSPGFGGFGFAPSPKRPVLSDMRARSYDGFSKPLISPFSNVRKERRKSDKKQDRQSYNPDGQKLFLFPTDY